jgi:uncharacterized damage-inducible protein DinB
VEPGHLGAKMSKCDLAGPLGSKPLGARIGERGQMKKTDIVTLVGFNSWANRRILAKASRLSPKILRAPAGLSYPSPLETLVHMLDTQWYWREGAEFGILPKERLESSHFPTMRSLRTRWDEEDRLLLEFVSGRTERQIAGTVTYTWPQARPRTRPLWHIIMHLVNHGTQHRSELAVFLTARKLSPGNMDFLDFIRHKATTQR